MERPPDDVRHPVVPDGPRPPRRDPSRMRRSGTFCCSRAGEYGRVCWGYGAGLAPAVLVSVPEREGIPWPGSEGVPIDLTAPPWGWVRCLRCVISDAGLGLPLPDRSAASAPAGMLGRLVRCLLCGDVPVVPGKDRYAADTVWPHRSMPGLGGARPFPATLRGWRNAKRVTGSRCTGHVPVGTAVRRPGPRKILSTTLADRRNRTHIGLHWPPTALVPFIGRPLSSGGL